MSTIISVKDLNLWYTNTQALKKHQHRNTAKFHHGSDWALRLRKINISQNAEPYE